MLTIPGQTTRTCDGISRREWLRVGGLGTVGVALPELLAAQEKAVSGKLPTGDGFGQAKACIVVFLFGAPAHQDTWDLKPNAPAEVRGEFSPIATNVPDLFVGEHIPRLAAMADKYAQLRAVTHPDNTHTVAMHYMLTGVRHKRPKTNPQNASDDFPCFGAVVNHLHKANDSRRGLPSAVSLNAPANQVSANNHIFPGFFAGFLGHGHDPLFISEHPNKTDFEPFPSLVDPDRLSKRRHLLDFVEGHGHQLGGDRRVADLTSHYERAFELLTAPATRQAFDLSQEPKHRRDRYGNTPFGQGCLLARRLVEAGVSLVTVNWERDDAYWDTHKNNFVSHRDKLLPNFDRGFSTLLTDLEDRGLLDETLVVCLGEFGRTPKINSNAGRDHWAACNTVVLAGAGIRGGHVFGASDRIAAYPARDPVTPEDLSATIYHLLGISPQITLHDPQDRPVRLSTGRVLSRLL